MLDIGWPELLVVAIVLIVVVGPKDLPPMLRAFGKMTTRLRKTAGEFRSQFDEALREADMDDVRQTISDARKLNPMNSVREALNPLRQAGNEIKSDLQKAVKADPVKGPVTETEADKELKLAEPASKLPAEPPELKTEPAKVDAEKPAAKKASAKSTSTRKPATSKSKVDSATASKATKKPAAAKPSAAKSAKAPTAKKEPVTAAEAAKTPKKTAAKKPAAAKKTGDA